MLGGRRRSETLQVGPSAAPLLDALTRRLASLTSALVVQPSGPGPWTAFYRGSHLIALARPSPGGGPTSLDLASPAIAWARRLTRPDDLDDEDVDSMLRLAIERAPTVTTRSLAELSSGPPDAVGCLLATGTIVLALLDWVVRTRRERAIANATGEHQELAILNAARREVGRRANAMTLGCAGATLVGLLSLVAAIAIGSWLNAAGSTLVVAAIWIVPLVAAVYVYWRVRRRFPYPPRPPTDRRKLVRDVVGFIVAVVVLVVLAMVMNR